MAKDHLGEVEVSNGAAIGGALVIFRKTRLYRDVPAKTIFFLIYFVQARSAAALSR